MRPFGFVDYKCSVRKVLFDENDLKKMGIFARYDKLRSLLYKSDERRDCVLIQGAAFVVDGLAYLLMGVGGIDFLDSLARNVEVDGVIGIGNALFISKDFEFVYSAHSKEELIRGYELEGFEHADRYNFLYSAPIGSLIFLLRSFKTKEEFYRTKKKYEGQIVFDIEDTFARAPVKFSGSLRARLRSKFIKTARVVHCARRPTLQEKECLFDAEDQIKSAVNCFRGKFVLVYTLWNQVLCDVVGMRKTRALIETQKKIDAITPHFIQLIRKINEGG